MSLSLFRFSVTGDREIDKVLKSLEPKEIKNAVVSAARKIAKAPLEAAQSNWPKSTDPNETPERIPGGTAASLKIKSGSRRAERQGVYGVRIWTGTREELGIKRNAKYYYPAAIEFGTQMRPPQRPIRRALEQTGEAGQAQFAKQVLDAIERKAKRLAKKGQRLKGFS